MDSTKSLLRATTAGLAIITAAGLVSGTASAQAEPTHRVTTTPAAPTYTENEVVDLFAFGAGRAATQHPNVTAALFGRKPAAAPSATTVNALTTSLEAVDPTFTKHVVPGLTSKDPLRTQSALDRFDNDLKQATKQHLAATNGNAPATANGVVTDFATYADSGVVDLVTRAVIPAAKAVNVATPDGTFYSNTNVLVDAEAVQSATAVTSVVVAGEVVALAFYRFNNGNSRFDKDQAVSTVAHAFA